MMVGTSSWFRLCILLAPLALACGGHTVSTPPGGGETNWLRACITIADCADCPGSDCVCGSCTLACSDSASCSAGPPGSTCAVAGSSALAAMCDTAPLPAGACLPPCAGGCASGTVCVADHCVPVRATPPADAAISDGSDGATDSGDASPNKCPAGVSGHCSAGASYPMYPGFTLALVEEFDEPIDLVTDPVWTYSDGFGEGRYTRYKKEAISFASGKLIITATTPAGGVANTGYPTYAEGVATAFPDIVAGTSTVQSGEFRTRLNNYRYGRYEFRMKAPGLNPTGNFINAFFTYRTPKWQQWREIDVEITPENTAQSAGTNIVWGNNPFSYGDTLNSYGAKPIALPDGGTVFDDFHVYAFEILPASVTWFADGTQIRQDTGTVVKLPEMSMKIMANLWVFPDSSWGGGLPVNNVYPMRSEIDWIRFYKADQEPAYPCSPTPSCVPAEDRDYSKNNAEDGLPSAAPW
jgi:endo-1,3-1,4-beta-glycanase ExoK